MDTLRSTSLSTILTANNTNITNNENSKKPKQPTTTVDKDTVTKLVKTFGELSKNEKILFLINIREYTRDGNHGVCNGTTPNNPDTNKQEPTTTTTTTPQSLRLSRTSNWLQKTFIQDTQVALPKEEVYSLYKHEFTKSNEKPISTADFGKLMRQVFPDVKARRLGQRGQSKYCYANIRKRSDVEKPALPTPLPTNELLTWAKNKFNIDFNDAGQVVSFLKSEGNGSNLVTSNSILSTRKRRASCGGNLLKQQKPDKGSSNTANNNNTTPKSSTQQRSASVSILESKDDPLMIYDNESLELGSYFENSTDNLDGPSSNTNTSATNWPQLRSLLVDESSNSNSAFLNSSALLSSTSALLCSKKKRHSSSVQFEFIKPDVSLGLLGNRSQSVPVNEMSFIRGSSSSSSLFDELQGGNSTGSLFDEFVGGSGGGGGGGGGGEVNNPMFSSAVVSGLTSKQNSNNSSCSSSSSSMMFESIGGSSSVGVGVVGGGGVEEGGSNSGIGVEVSIGGGVAGGSQLLSNGVVGGGGGGDVFFDSVFDLMMSDCQN